MTRWISIAHSACISILVAALFAAAETRPSSQTIDYQGIYTLGDSVSAGVNADDGTVPAAQISSNSSARASLSSRRCSNGEEPHNAWATSVSPRSDESGTVAANATKESDDTPNDDTVYCEPDAVHSYAERAKCAAAAAFVDSGTSSSSGGRIQHVVNVAVRGAKIVGDLKGQALRVRDIIIGGNRSALRNKVIVFAGHNDVCSGTDTRLNANCSNSDQDPSFYCVSRQEAVESELNRGTRLLHWVDRSGASDLHKIMAAACMPNGRMKQRRCRNL